MSLFPVELEGSPREIGYKRGRIFRDLIRSIAEARLTKITGARRRDHMEMALRIESVLNETYPELVEELRGMAEGSNLDYEDILMLNAWWDNPIGCSNVALTETSKGPALGSTLDIGRSPYLAMMLFKPEKGYSFIHVASPGLLGVARAMNEAGLCLGGSSVKATDMGMGFPRYALYRVVIQYCSTVEESIRLFERFREGYRNPANVILLDKDGNAAVVEQTNTRVAVRWAEDGGVACTNHYVEEETRRLQRPARTEEEVKRLRNSIARYKRLVNFIRRADRENPVESLKRILRSHGRGGLCQHGGFGRLHATVAFIMLPRTGEFYASQPVGFYCQSQFIRYTPFQ
ncbi:hypothetical protein DRO55_03195 [Candidatus Bathyarchaeota archaeon]|nr:MAG: hypothetical protein DRO55_03195 [Candidatus Bathyarchaeota archaeon]